jgi:hypothetical protein
LVDLTGSKGIAMLLDSTFDAAGEGTYSLTQVHRTPGGHTVRVRVHRDYYSQQSHAVAEVFSTERTWTQLATTPAGQWHPGTPLRDPAASHLQPVADDLLDRAQLILPATQNARPE